MYVALCLYIRLSGVAGDKLLSMTRHHTRMRRGGRGGYTFAGDILLIVIVLAHIGFELMPCGEFLTTQLLDVCMDIYIYIYIALKCA